MSTPLRRLDGIAFWVIEEPEAIADFLNTEIRKEWEEDACSEGRDPRQDPWLQSLARRKWSLAILAMDEVKLDPAIMNYVNLKTGYRFTERLAKRRNELRKTIETFGNVIWPMVVKREGMELVDGYCRYTTLREMGVSRTYAYVGSP